MRVENHKEEMPFAHYATRFPDLDPAEVTARLPFVGWDGSAFSLELLGQKYQITWPEYSITPDAPRVVQTLLLRILEEVQDLPAEGSWKTFRELPWGEVYTKAYSGRVLTRAAFAFGPRLDGFRRAAAQIGGSPVRHGDAGYEFCLTGPYRLRLLVWAGDEEFPPSAQILYTGNFALGFTAEDRVVIGDILISRVKGAMK